MGIFNEHSTSQTYGPQIIPGPPGIGFVITKDGNYDIRNKKLTNVKPGMDDSDVLTKKQIYDHIKANGGDSSRPSVDLTDYFKKMVQLV